jgi:hypothetical protein
MGRSILKLVDKRPKRHKSWYLEWSSVVDAPVTEGMTKAEFERYYFRTYQNYYHGDDGSIQRQYKERMERVEKKGTSSRIFDSAEEEIVGNRAGHQEATLTLDEIIDQYCIAPRRQK